MATKAATTPTYAPTALPTTGTQYRLTSGGTGTPQATAYVQATRQLASWARGGANAPLVHALVHLGWCAGSGARATCKAANSAAYRHGAPHLQAGQPAAPQVVATMQALAKAGAPVGPLAVVWATFTGSAA